MSKPAGYCVNCCRHGGHHPNCAWAGRELLLTWRVWSWMLGLQEVARSPARC
jgi:hypothetical protein